MTDVAEPTRLVRAQGVTAPAGFRAAGIAAGIKKSGGRDLALVFTEGFHQSASDVFLRSKGADAGPGTGLHFTGIGPEKGGCHRRCGVSREGKITGEMMAFETPSPRSGAAGRTEYR